MKLNLYRHTYNTTGDRNVIGDLFIDGQFYCHTLEDEKRADGEKVYGKTCIPVGTYKVKLTMSSRFKKIMPLLLDVPMFSGVRMHGGNTSADTLGCILVAFNTDYKKIWLSAANKLTERLKEAENITITIEDKFLSYDKINKCLR